MMSFPNENGKCSQLEKKCSSTAYFTNTSFFSEKKKSLEKKSYTIFSAATDYRLNK